MTNIQNCVIDMKGIDDKRNEVLLELAKSIQAVAEAVIVDRRNITGIIVYPENKIED